MYSIKFTITITTAAATNTTAGTATDDNDYNENIKDGTLRSNF